MEEIIISGFGGQGTLFAGQVLAYAAMDADFHVTWIPSYGPEMRGGKARCTVIISDQEIGSPLVRRPSAAIVMNIPSFETFEPMVKPGGVLVVNQSLVPHRSQREDIRALYVPATELATDMGNMRVANMGLPGCAGPGAGHPAAGGTGASAGSPPGGTPPEMALVEQGGAAQRR